MAFEIGKTVAGYEIVEVLGTSKTGVAYKVRNVFAQRFEVMKILPKSIQDDEEQNARFLREIKVHAQLLHPNIVTFYNAREIEGQLVMTKEFVPGITLEEKLHAGPIAWREACGYACHALAALEYAHTHGIIHRGFSSSNLIITNEGIARLNGFGFAKSLTDPQLTAAGVVIGALKYMSPEQVKGETVDARSDIYSLGIVLYETLTGKVPFDAKSQFEIMMAQVNSVPPHVSDVNPAVPRDLGDLVAKTLAKSPADRFQTARECREAVERVSLRQDLPVEKPDADSVWHSAPDVKPVPVEERIHLVEPFAPPAIEPLPAVVSMESFMTREPDVVSTGHADLDLAAIELKSEPEKIHLVDTPSPDPSATPVSTPAPEPVTAAEPAPAPIDWQGLTNWVTSTLSVLQNPAQEQTPAEVALTDSRDVTASTGLSDAQAIESAINSAESTLAGEPELAAVSTPAAEIQEPAASRQPAADWWTLNTQLQPAASSQAEFALTPPEPESLPPTVTAVAIADPPSDVAEPSLFNESGSNPAQLDLLSAAWESPKAPAEVPNVIETPAPSSTVPHQDLWAALPLHDEFAHEPADKPALSSFADEPARSSANGEPHAEEPVSLWTSGPPDTWVSEPAPAPEVHGEAGDLASLSAAVEKPEASIESAALTEFPPHPSFQPEPPAAEPQLAAGESTPEPVAEAPQVVAAAAEAREPAPAAQRSASANPDLLTALFGDTLLSRVSLTLVVCAITFLLGTVTLFAVLSVSKP